MSAMVQDNLVLLRRSARDAAKPQARGKWLREGPDSRPRAFPVASTPPTLPAKMSDDLLDFYAFIFCQGGFGQTGMTFEQFLLVLATVGPLDQHAAHPDDALAHYHLGFAYGMLGRHGEELAEYRQAASLGLKQWDLFLNLGLAYLEDGNVEAATDALTTAASLGPDHPEGHFNLGLVYERRGMFAQARQEMVASLRLDPRQRDARNMLGVIDAEDGDYADARQIWSDLARTEPDFGPARANLAILGRMEDSAKAGLSRALGA